jgi:hypothetical protein
MRSALALHVAAIVGAAACGESPPIPVPPPRAVALSVPASASASASATPLGPAPRIAFCDGVSVGDAGVSSPTAPLRLFSGAHFSGDVAEIDRSVLSLASFKDASGRCRELLAPAQSFTLAVGYSAVFYAHLNFDSECLRVGPTVDHDRNVMPIECAKVSSIRLVRGSLENGTEVLSQRTR